MEACTAICAANGNSLAGVEYGQECYCGACRYGLQHCIWIELIKDRADNVIANGQGLAPDGDTWCNMPCQGDNSEICGGSLRVDIYTTTPAWVPMGCYYDKPWARTLAVGGTYDGSLTVEKCLATCGAAGYQYAGLEWVRNVLSLLWKPWRS